MANARTADAVITIEAEETEWLLHPFAGNESCCIFRVPQCLAEIQPKTYQPHIVSIGPYHYGKPHLKMMQQHKQRYLRDLLARTESTGPKLDDYLQAVASREPDIRDCYSEYIEFDSGSLVKMMVLDGLFIIELFCRQIGQASVPLPPSHVDDPIFNLAWVMPNFTRDLLRLENQIPFFILQILYDKSKPSRNDSDSSFENVAFKFMSRAVEVVNQQFMDEPKHLLDLVRLSFIPLDDPPQVKKHIYIPPLLVQLFRSAKTSLEVIKSNTRKGVGKLRAGLKLEKKKADIDAPSVQLIKSARKLYLSGIKFKKHVAATSLLDVRFRKGVFEIPNMTLDDLRTDLFLNFVAFEQHRYWYCPYRPITSYAVFMSCLIRTPEDATYLRDKDIIDNYLGTDEAVANFFKSLGKDVSFDIEDSHLCKLFQEVNEYQRNLWHVRWAGFKVTYFATPWSFLSALAAVILLLLTVLQSFYAVYAFYHPK